MSAHLMATERAQLAAAAGDAGVSISRLVETIIDDAIAHQSSIRIADGDRELPG